jgi:endonuclease YncB( thermonuclease family)
MNRPPLGLCLLVERPKVHDGDTIAVVLVGGSHVWRVRLLDCWCPESNAPGGREAKQYAEKLLDQCRRLALFIPAPEGENLLKELFSFDRVLGHLFISETQTLSEMMVAAGHATKEKTTKGQ